MTIIQDLICPRCKSVFENVAKTISIMYGYMVFSICPKCTGEVAGLMGYTEESLLTELGKMQDAETVKNRQYDINNGTRCAKCEAPFAEHGPRVSSEDYDNCKKYHLACYEAIR